MATYYNPQDVFLAAYPAVAGMEFANGLISPPTRIDFTIGTDQNAIDTINAAAAVFDWVPLTPPNTQGFVAAIEGDSSLTSILELLMPFYAAIENYTIDPQVIKTAWAELKVTYSSQLTPAIVQTIEGYASANRMPLT